MKIKKRLVVLSLLLAFITPCFAETIDIANCTNEELLSLLDTVQREVAARHIEKTAQLPAGTFVGGKDIPVGSYVLSSAGREGQDGVVSLRPESSCSENENKSKLYEFTTAAEAYVVYITVEEGDVLILPYPFRLTISAGIIFE